MNRIKTFSRDPIANIYNGGLDRMDDPDGNRTPNPGSELDRTAVK